MFPLLRNPCSVLPLSDSWKTLCYILRLLIYLFKGREWLQSFSPQQLKPSVLFELFATRIYCLCTWVIYRSAQGGKQLQMPTFPSERKQPAQLPSVSCGRGTWVRPQHFLSQPRPLQVSPQLSKFPLGPGPPPLTSPKTVWKSSEWRILDGAWCPNSVGGGTGLEGHGNEISDGGLRPVRSDSGSPDPRTSYCTKQKGDS